MAIITNKGHVSRAIDFYEKNDLYFTIGKRTAWSETDRTTSTSSSVVVDDYNPPIPNIDSEMIDLIGAKKVERSYLIKPDPEGTLSYRGTKWKIVSKEDALSEGARWVYLSTSLSYNELPINISYRIIGIATKITRQPSVDESKYVLDESEIKDLGITEVIDYRKPLYRESDQREELVVIIEF